MNEKYFSNKEKKGKNGETIQILKGGEIRSVSNVFVMQAWDWEFALDLQPQVKIRHRGVKHE